MRTGDLFDHLDAKPGEMLVVSAVVARGQTTDPTLLHASALIVPAEVAAVGWPGWQHATTGKKPTSARSAEVPSEFLIDLDDHLVGRVAMSLTTGRAWLKHLFEEGVGLPAGPLPRFRAQLAAARAPVRIASETETEAGAFVSCLERPFAGYLFRAAEPMAPAPAIPDTWSWNGDDLYNPALDLLGMSWFASRTTPMTQGLLLARMEQRAWLTEHRLNEEGQFTVGIGLDLSQISLDELALEVEERVDDETIWSEHLALVDVDLRAVLDEPRVTVMLPSIGWGGVRRAVRLRHVDGFLLDEWRPFVMVERVGLNINGAQSWIGEERGPLEMVHLLAAVERVRSEFAQLRRGGLAARLLDDPAEGREALRRLIARARGEVLVIDPYFTDWSLLDAAAAGARVLIGAALRHEPPEAYTGRFRQWRPTSADRVAPFHDRFIVWDGGGVAIGTSTGTAGRRYYRISRLAAVEADELRERFALWWQDDGFGSTFVSA